jgi:hypothetical protein
MFEEAEAGFLPRNTYRPCQWYNRFLSNTCFARNIIKPEKVFGLIQLCCEWHLPYPRSPS